MNPYMQTVLTGLMALNGSSSPNRIVQADSNVTAASSMFPVDLPGIVALLFSYSALGDWLKLILIGGFIETCRRMVFWLYSKLVSSFWVTAYFEDTDACYMWMMVWLANQPAWKRSRNVQISTSTYANSNAITLDGEDNHSRLYKSFRKLSYFPSLSVKYDFWYKGTYMNITRTQQQSGVYGHKENTLNISLLTRNRDILIQLLQEARSAYLSGQENSMAVFVADSMSGGWRHVASRAKRSLSSIILDPGIKELLLNDARSFLGTKSWYNERGIPYRRGYLLWGAPGSGKSSLIHAIAGELGLDIYIISLAKAGMDDSSLNELINRLPERCIALMEDVDAAFTQGLTREAGDEPPYPARMNFPPPGMLGLFPGMPGGGNRLTLSGLLNALDGVSAQEGRILFATTNKYSSLDAALCRPGRMDVHIEFKLASRYQAKELFLKFFNPGLDSSSSSKELVQHDDESDSESDDSIASSLDSGYDSAHHTHSPESEKPAVVGALPLLKLSPERLEHLADRFSNALPDREFSMATLQGYLMMYKTQPQEAADRVGEWSRKEKMERDAKGNEEEEEGDKKLDFDAVPGVGSVVLSSEMESEINQRVEREVRERMVRERLEQELAAKIEKEMTMKMDRWFSERGRKDSEVNVS